MSECGMKRDLSISSNQSFGSSALSASPTCKKFKTTDVVARKVSFGRLNETVCLTKMIHQIS